MASLELMLKRLISILKKTKKYGFIWAYRRTLLELRIPETPMGKKIIPMNQFIYGLFSILLNPMRIFKRNEIMKKTLYLFYDLEISPVTFNFCETLSVANLHKNRLGLQYLYVVFVPGPYHGLRKESEDYERIIDVHSRLWRKRNILFPLTGLMPSCVGFTDCATRKEAEHIITQIPHHNVYPPSYSTMFPTCVSFYEGAQSHSLNTMALKATTCAMQYIAEWLKSRLLGRKLIVITLRQYSYMAARNSNLEAWENFSKSLDPQLYFVVIVPDTETALQKPEPKLSAFEHFREACFNIELRAALYESAYLNLSVNTGPFILCVLNKQCRYILFKIITESVPQTTKAAQIAHGFMPGHPPAFAQPYQAWVWEDDTEQTIQREFLRMCKILEK